MGYDGIIITKKESDKLRVLLNKSKKFTIVKSVSTHSPGEPMDDRIRVRLEDDEVVVHDLDTKKLEKFLDKNKIKY